jgi:hypothetical protein
MARRIAGRSKKAKVKRSKGRARPKSVAVRACAACGSPERETRRLVTRSALSVCEPCVLELARELQAGAAVAKPETAAPEPLPEGMTPAPAPAEICGWQKFRLEGKKLEWRAERTVVQAARPAVLVHVRRSSADRHVTLTMHPGSTPTREDAERAGHWLLSPPAEDPELSDGPEAFGPLGVLEAWQRLEVDGQPLEWSAERAYVYEATPYVQIEVREHQSANRATTYLDWRTEPTLDHAIAAARELWSGDGVAVEI